MEAETKMEKASEEELKFPKRPQRSNLPNK